MVRALILGCLLLAWPAFGQTVPPPGQLHGFTPCAGNPPAALTLAAATSANVQVLTCGNSLIVYNLISSTSFIAMGTSNAITATAASIPIPANTFIVFTLPSQPATWLAAFNTAGSATVPGIFFAQGWNY
jgi:hypothetical protein